MNTRITSFALHIVRALAIHLVIFTVLFSLTKEISTPIVLLLVIHSTLVTVILRWLKEPLGFVIANALFPILCFVSMATALPSWIFALVTLIVILVFSPTLSTGVPLFTSSKEAALACVDLLPSDRKLTIAELGAGEGTFVSFLARERPQATCIAFELSILGFLILKLRSIRQTNITVRKADFMKHPWSTFDVLYCFLAPPVMSDVWNKFQSEAKPGSVLISNAFPVPEVVPTQIVKLMTKHEAALYVYRHS